MKKFKLNENYFDIVDTEQKSYWLGLQKRDLNHIKLFKNHLSCDKTIYHNLNNCVLRLESKHMCESLIKLGCIPRKSLILKFPTEEQVPNHLLRHFVRGYFDGDGSAYLQAGKECCKICSGSFDFLYSMNQIFLKELNIVRPIERSSLTCNCYHIRWIKRGYVKSIRDYMYDNSNVYLGRKFNILSEVN